MINYRYYNNNLWNNMGMYKQVNNNQEYNRNKIL